MIDGHRDDASYWINFTPTAHAAETARLTEWLGDAARARAFLEYGLRPFGAMDVDPYNQPVAVADRPWEPSTEDIEDQPYLVDTQTGWRFRYDRAKDELALDLRLSDNFLDAQILLGRVACRDFGFRFSQHVVPAIHQVPGPDRFSLTQPLEFSAASMEELEAIVARLEGAFCDEFRARRLWFRGQRAEYLIDRSREITNTLYGRATIPSLLPSVGRYAYNHPDQMNFGFAFHGPNHAWKKPFLIWLMRENRDWFAHEPRCLDLLSQILHDPDDMRFSMLLCQIQLSPVEIGDPPHLAWPDEADDLRQWFFAFMKRFEFGVTLQQYGYYSSLLDVTDNLDVALYFTQAGMIDGRMQRRAPKPGRVIYVFAESPKAAFMRHGNELFWGGDGWTCNPPPRLQRQHAGFISGSTNRTQNFYAQMIVARIELASDGPETSLEDANLFPSPENDLLLATLREARPNLQGLY